jgi:P-loop containing dynein motor region D4
VLDVAAVKNENVVLLMEDFQVVNPVFLEIVTSILANGEFAGLYTEEETDKINNLVADQMAQESFDGTTAAFLISRKTNC